MLVMMIFLMIKLRWRITILTTIMTIFQNILVAFDANDGNADNGIMIPSVFILKNTVCYLKDFY